MTRALPSRHSSSLPHAQRHQRCSSIASALHIMAPNGKAALSSGSPIFTDINLGSCWLGHWRDERLIVTSAINGRYLRSHRTQIGRQLAAMMDAVVAQES